MSGGGERVRAFFAVALDARARAALVAAIARLREADGAGLVRFVAPASLHLTLRFLGEVDPAALESMRGRVERAVADHPAHRVGFADLGAFPTARRPRVVVVRLAASPALAALGRAVEAAVVAAGQAPERRRFRPHVTLGRVRGRAQSGVDLAPVLAASPAPDAHLEVDAVTLFRSELARGGARYTALARIPLPTPAAAGPA